jgi:hypothetical protein
MLEIGRISFLVGVDEHQVEWSRRRRESLEGLCGWAKYKVDFVDEARRGEVLSCDLDATGVYVESGDGSVFWDGAGEPSG